MSDASVRILYEWNCTDCEKQEYSGCPVNPLHEPPMLVQALPQGWTLVIDGGNPGVPVVSCGCTKDGSDEARMN